MKFLKFSLLTAVLLSVVLLSVRVAMMTIRDIFRRARPFRMH